MNDTTTHYLSKEEVAERLQSFHYSFEECYWDAFLESHSNSRFASPKAPALKLSPKLLAIPLSLIIVSTIIYLSINNLKSQNTSSESLDHKQEAAILPSPQPTAKTIATPVKHNTPDTKQAEVVVPKTGTVIKKEITNTPTPVAKIIQPEKPIVKKQAPSEEMSTAQASDKAVNNESVEKKKKKKRRSEKSAADNTLIPSPEDDNIVVPEN